MCKGDEARSYERTLQTIDERMRICCLFLKDLKTDRVVNVDENVDRD